MNCSACSEKLHDYAAGSLSATEVRAVDAHLAACATCRAELAAVRRLRAATAALPREINPPHDGWPALAALTTSLPPLATSSRLAPLAFRLLVPLATAATIAFLSAWLGSRPTSRVTPHTPWSVAAMAGAPIVAARPIAHETSFRVGQWLETDAISRAKVSVGRIGEVRVEPNSRVRLVGASPTDHRIELARGTVDALIWAPPRLFFVDTPSATAVDLGCAYTLTVDDAGNGELHVTAGYVALEHGARESIIPSGLRCLTRRGSGPGTPFHSDTAPELRAAIEAFDFGPSAARAPAIAQILAHAQAIDDVTLWHLLGRSAGAERAAVFDTLARVSPPPAGVTRAAILAGDAAARRSWATALGLGPFPAP